MGVLRKTYEVQKILGFMIVVVAIMSACGGPQYPFDDSFKDSSDLGEEIREGRSQIETLQADPCYDQWNIPKEYRKVECGGIPSTPERVEPDDWYDDRDKEDESNGCPTGCTNHKTGCDIKGNMSFDTEEKIYHVPGD